LKPLYGLESNNFLTDLGIQRSKNFSKAYNIILSQNTYKMAKKFRIFFSNFNRSTTLKELYKFFEGLVVS